MRGEEHLILHDQQKESRCSFTWKTRRQGQSEENDKGGTDRERTEGGESAVENLKTHINMGFVFIMVPVVLVWYQLFFYTGTTKTWLCVALKTLVVPVVLVYY